MAHPDDDHLATKAGRVARAWRPLGAALAGLALLGLTSPAAATLLLTGKFIQLPIDDTGSVGRFMGTGDSQGGKYNPAGTGGGSGTDFWVFGTPVYNYTIAVDGVTFRTNGTGWSTPPTVIDTSVGTAHSALISGDPVPSLHFTRAVFFGDSDQVVVVTDTLTNTGLSALTQVATLDNLDPDQDTPIFSDFTTLNDVVSAAATNDLVLASGPEDGLTIGLGSPDPLRVVDASGFSNTNPYPIIAAPNDPNGLQGDIGIDLAINYGTLGAGASQTVTWMMTFGASKSAATTNYLASLGVCGNGIVEAGEACDDGVINGTSASCCTVTCRSVCDDANACTDDSCSSTSGAFVCSHTDNNDPCSTGTACIVGSTCSGGSCTGGTPIVCDDSNPCTDDFCDSAGGCFTVFNSNPCDDGNACTDDDKCTFGGCSGTFNTAPCDDLNSCTDDDRCSFGTCRAGTFNTSPCDDGNPCTANDRCSFGSCLSGGPLDCNDNNPCTTEFCAPFVGCRYTNLNGPRCDDQDPCTTDDVCHMGHCTGDPRNCSDDDACTVDSCDSAGGAFLCQHEDCNTIPSSSCPAHCSPARCGNGVIDPGETCDPPDPTPDPQRPGEARCRADCTFCGDGVVQAGHGETCDDGNLLSGCNPARPTLPLDACQNVCTGPICHDPSNIKLSPNGGMFNMHGRIAPVAPGATIDPGSKTFVVELTDASGVVLFRSSLEAGLLQLKGVAYSYANPAAAQPGGSGGFSKVKIVSRAGAYMVTLRAYGDLSGATDRMTTHIFIDAQEWTLAGRWVRTARGWRLDLASAL